MSELYDNREGYSTEALRLVEHVRSFAESILTDYPDCNALELSALMHAAIDEARTRVSLRRRLDPEAP